MFRNPANLCMKWSNQLLLVLYPPQDRYLNQSYLQCMLCQLWKSYTTKESLHPTASFTPVNRLRYSILTKTVFTGQHQPSIPTLRSTQMYLDFLSHAIPPISHPLPTLPSLSLPLPSLSSSESFSSGTLEMSHSSSTFSAEIVRSSLCLHEKLLHLSGLILKYTLLLLHCLVSDDAS